MITLDPPKQKRRSLEALQEARLPRLDWRTILTVTDGELSEADVKALDEYFRHFVSCKNECVKCGAQQGAKDMVGAFLGQARFTWGLANGEGFCGACKYPARAYHRDVGPIKFLNLILQYHPDELSEASRPKAADSVPHGNAVLPPTGASPKNLPAPQPMKE